MNNEKTLAPNSFVKTSRNTLLFTLGASVIMAATHGVFSLDTHHSTDLSDLSAKIASEAHTHQSESNTYVAVDPRALKNVRSDNDKSADKNTKSSDSSWDFYME